MIYCHKKLFDKKRKVTVACSAGADSIAVAHFIQYKMRIDVELFHFNHKLRNQNDEMEEAVIDFSNEFNMPYQIHARSKTDVVE